MFEEGWTEAVKREVDEVGSGSEDEVNVHEV
jgi:hypothetical protein